MRYSVTEKDGVYTATIPIPLSDGQELLIQGKASVGEVMDELGLCLGCGGVCSGSMGCDHSEVGWNLFEEIGKVGKSVVKEVKKIGKGKAVRKAVKIAKDVITNPVTHAALGVVTGGASVPGMAAATAAIKLADEATKDTPRGKKARKVLKRSVKLAKRREREQADRREYMRKHYRMPPRIYKTRITKSEYNAKIKQLKRLLEGQTIAPQKREALREALINHIQGRPVTRSEAERAVNFLVKFAT
jgi:hypothetical protein